METGNEYAHKGETIYLSEKRYLRTLDYLGYAWETGKLSGWDGRTSIAGGTVHSWSPDNAIGLYDDTLALAQEWQREDRTNA